MTDSSKSELERLSKENFNLKLRLHYFEEQQNTSSTSASPTRQQAAEEESGQVAHYRNLVEEAKAIISDLQDTLTHTQEELAFATNELEEHREATRQERIQRERDLAQLDAYRLDLAQAQRDLASQAEERSSQHQAEVAELRQALERTKRAGEEELKRARGEVVELARTAQQSSGEAEELRQELNEIKRARSTAPSPPPALTNDPVKYELAELKRVRAEEARRYQQEIAELRSALLASKRPSPSNPTSESQLFSRLKQAEMRISDLKQALVSQQRQHEQELRLARTKPSSPSPPNHHDDKDGSIWEQLALRCTGSAHPQALLAFIQDLQRAVRDWELVAERVVPKAKLPTPQSLQQYLARYLQEQQQQSIQKRLPSLERVEMAENMLREATDRLERLERHGAALRSTPPSLLDRENRRLASGSRGRSSNNASFV
ncbi:hypothetical protein BASA81_004079 [Batrachochytrium salamandrivorans]|nr:hypothetical protein BASA81_004079 [Batrachochytrium salamandrivorans]